MFVCPFLAQSLLKPLELEQIDFGIELVMTKGQIIQSQPKSSTKIRDAGQFIISKITGNSLFYQIAGV